MKACRPVFQPKKSSVFSRAVFPGAKTWLVALATCLLIAMGAESTWAQWGGNHGHEGGGIFGGGNNHGNHGGGNNHGNHGGGLFGGGNNHGGGLFGGGGHHNEHSESDLERAIHHTIPGIIDSISDAERHRREREHHHHQPTRVFRPAQVTNSPQHVTQPQSNFVRSVVRAPVEKPKANKVVAQPVKVTPNVLPLSLMRTAGKPLLDALNDQIENKTDDEVRGIQDLMDQKKPPLAEVAANLKSGGTDGYSKQEKIDILQHARDGDIDAVTTATFGDNSPEAKALRDFATAQDALLEVHDAVIAGELTDKQRTHLNNALVKGGFSTPGTQAALRDHFQQLDVNNGLAEIVNSTVPGGSVGPVDTLVLVGGMNEGEVIYLGSGATLVGTQGATEGVVIAHGTAGNVLGMPAFSGEPSTAYDGNPIPRGAYVINRGPTEVQFTVAGKRHSLAPGMMESFRPGSRDKIEFYRHGESEFRKYTFEEGTYDFKYADDHWELYRQKYRITLNNPGNSSDFHYVINNTSYTLAAEDQKEHTSKYPMVLRFDDGKGHVKQRRIISGTYSVAISDNALLDVIATSQVDLPLPLAELAAPPHTVDFFGKWDGKSRRRSRLPARRRPIASNAPRLFQ